MSNPIPEWTVPDGLPPGNPARIVAGGLWPGQAARADLRRRHYHGHTTNPRRDYCPADDQDWPCEVAGLLAALEAAESTLRTAEAVLPAAHLVAGHRDMLISACALAAAVARPAAAANYLHLEQALRGLFPVPAVLSPPAGWLTEWGVVVSEALSVASDLLDHGVEECTVCAGLDEPCARHKADRVSSVRFRDARREMPQ